MESTLNLLSVVFFCHDKLEIGRVVQYENTRINIYHFKCKFRENKGVIDQNACSDFFKNLAFESFFP